jgi:hypothetical protein
MIHKPKKNREKSVDELLDEFRTQVRMGQPLNFKSFGLQHSQYAELVKIEQKERVIKKKDYMKDIHIH